MTAHAKMDAPDRRRILDHTAQGVIGRPADRTEGVLKVTGGATYAHEWPVPDALHGVLVRAPFAHGQVTSLDKAAVTALPGVVDVIADPRFVRNPAQGKANEAPVQGCEDVAYFGQPVALVVAESFEQARHGAHMLEISFKADDDFVIDPESADAPIERLPDDQFEQGDIETAMREGRWTVDETWTTPGHNSAPMEPHAAIAEWEDDNLLLRGSYQMPAFNRNELADCLGVEAEKVRILAPYVGGGFGSKLGIAPEAVSAAIAAKQLGRPVSVALARQAVFEAVMRRSETRQRIRLAADADGRLIGLAQETRVSNLPDEAFSEPANQATHFLYGGQHRLITKEIARVNRTCAGSVRAPGEAVGVQTIENAMDELAEKSGIDPVELRKRNIPERHPERDIPYSARRLADCLDEGARRFGWDKRDPEPGGTREGEWLIGMGMASCARVNMLVESRARVRLEPHGGAIVETDMTDIGTGTYTILTQIAAEMLGLPMARVEVRLGDTDFPAASGSGGSFGASSCGSSVFLACEELRGRLARRMDCEPADLTLKDGGAIAGNRRAALEELLDGEAMDAEGHVEPGATGEDVVQAAFGAHFAEVAVSRYTGETRVRRMQGDFAAGRILNEKTARSQCQGGMAWGIGIALTEELMHDPRDGHIANRDLAEYHLPVNLDVPQIDVRFLEERDDWANPMQTKGVGELAICGAAAAITNAIYNACGVRVRDYPATPDKVLAGLA